MIAKPWREHLEKVRPYTPGKSPEEVRISLGLDDIIKVASNESPHNPPQEVIKAISAAAADIRTYPDARCSRLRAKLAAKHAIAKEKFVFGNGSDEIIVLAARAFLDSSSEVILPEPSFLYYKIVCDCQDARVINVPASDGFGTNVKAVLNAVTEKTRLIYLSNPCNPTGSMLGPGQISELIEGLNENVALFLDEAYYEYVESDLKSDLYSQIERKDRIIILSRTFSKAYALAGLRIGYGMMREDVAEILQKVRPPFNVNSLAQAAAEAALDCEDVYRGRIDEAIEERKRLCSGLDNSGISFIPSQSNFLLIDTGCSSSEVSDRLLRKGIIVRDMAAWGLKGFIRANISLPEHNDRFLSALREAVENLPEMR